MYYFKSSRVWKLPTLLPILFSGRENGFYSLMKRATWKLYFTPSVYKMSYATREYVFTPSRDRPNHRDVFTVPRPLNSRSGCENAFYSLVPSFTIFPTLPVKTCFSPCWKSMWDSPLNRFLYRILFRNPHFSAYYQFSGFSLFCPFILRSDLDSTGNFTRDIVS